MKHMLMMIELPSPLIIICMLIGGGVTTIDHLPHEPLRIVPHPRTIRKAREQIKCMVNDGVSLPRIRNYLHRFVLWWANSSTLWQYEEILQIYIQSCWNPLLRIPAHVLLRKLKESRNSISIVCRDAA